MASRQFQLNIPDLITSVEDLDGGFRTIAMIDGDRYITCYRRNCVPSSRQG